VNYLTPAQASLLDEMIDSNEPASAIQILVGILHGNQVILATEARKQLVDILEHLDVEVKVRADAQSLIEAETSN
jgi:hypothetical protein